MERHLGKAMWAALLAALLAACAGCGSTSAAPPSVQTQNLLARPSVQPTATPAVQPTASPVARSSQRPASASPATSSKPALPAPPVPLYQQAIQQYAALNGYSAGIRVFGRLNEQAVGATVTVQWQAPRLLRLQILDTNLLKGDQTTLLYEGGTNVRVKAPQWAPIAATVALDDPRLRLPNGQRFDELTIGGLLARFQAKDVQIKSSGEVTWKGRPVQVYELHTPDDARRGVTKQVIGIERQHRYPIFAEQHGAQGLVNQIVVDSFQPNPAFPAGTFAL